MTQKPSDLGNHHSCMTGDCEHEHTQQCLVALGEYIDELLEEIKAHAEVTRWSQAVLTAWNTGDMARESLLHKKFRSVMIHYRQQLTRTYQGLAYMPLDNAADKPA